VLNLDPSSQRRGHERCVECTEYDSEEWDRAFRDLLNKTSERIDRDDGRILNGFVDVDIHRNLILLKSLIKSFI
jgi:hypothetical protein